MFQLYDHKLLIISVAAMPAIAYVCWKWYPKAEKRKQNSKLMHFVPGLINSGNTCFMNSTLQCMASLPYFARWLDQFCQLSHVDSNILMAETLNKIFKKLNGNCDETVFDSSDLLLDLSTRGWQIASEEHDAHEFFYCLLSTLDEEVKYYLKHSVYSALHNLVNSNFVIPNEGKSITLKFNISKKSKTSAVAKKIKQTSFHGLLSIRLQCSQCGHKNPVAYESFHSLSLPIDHSRGKTLLECLQSFLACEMLTNVECVNCTQKKQNHSKNFFPLQARSQDEEFVKVSQSVHSALTFSKMNNQMLQPKQFKSSRSGVKEKVATASFFKRSHITKFPPCLCIHLKRLIWRHGQPIKLYHQVVYPEILDLQNFKFRYLYSVANHKEKRLYMDPIFSSLVDQRPNFNLIAMRSAAGLTDVKKCNGLAKSLIRKKTYTSMQLYQLSGVLVHLGDWSHSGHFVAYRRHVLKDSTGHVSTQWYYTSDDYVKKVSVHDVLNHPAYMLFYEKIVTK